MPSSRRAAVAPTHHNGEATEGGVRVLKKYPNRRLYDTGSSSYITLADVKRMVLTGVAFEVRDAKSAEDLTRSILLQIILEEESGGVPLFTTETLAQMIRFYGHAMQGMMGEMLALNMQTFADLQQKMLGQSAGLYEPRQLAPEAWTQFLNGQAPMLQGLMGSYAEQSRRMFEQLIPGLPSFTPPPKR